MSAVHLTSAAPAWATTVWCDSAYLYVEYPAADGVSPPYVIKYARTSTGLQEALKGMIIEHDKRAPKSHYVPTVPVQMPEKKPKGETKRQQFKSTREQRAGALEILKKLGLK